MNELWLMLALGLGMAGAPVGPYVPADTVVVLGARTVDLTGDGREEVLEVVGRGDSLDSLGVTFVVRSSERILYSLRLAPIARTSGFDAGRRNLSPEEYRMRLEGFGEFFFAEERFQSPVQFLARLERSAPRLVDAIADVIARDAEVEMGAARAAAIWEDIQRRGAAVFEVPLGGDGVTAIAWSQIDGRFYRLFECC